MYIIGKLFSIICILLCGLMASVFLEPGITWKLGDEPGIETALSTLSAKIADKAPAPGKTDITRPIASEPHYSDAATSAAETLPRPGQHKTGDNAMLAALLPSQNRGSLMQSLEKHQK